MASNINDLDAGVVPRIQDPAGVLGFDQRKACILSALAEYQAVRPRELVVALVGSGSFDYNVTGLTGFVEGFSTVLQVRGPVVPGDPAPPLLDSDEWALVRLPSSRVLRFLAAVPSASETYHVYLTAPHSATASACTVFVQDDQAVMDLAAHHCCIALAAYYSQETDGSIGADTVDRGGKAETYRSLARSYRDSYDQKMSLNTAEAPAFATEEIDRRGFGLRGRFDYLLHGRSTH